MKAEVRHHRRNDRAARELPAALHIRAAHGEYLVAVDDAALLVDEKAAVGIAVEGNADVVAARDDLGRKIVKMRRAAALVNVHAVRLAVDKVAEAAETAEELRRGRGRRAVRAVHKHAQAGKVTLDGAGKMIDVRLARLAQAVAQHADLAVRGSGIDVGEDLLLHLLFDGVGQLVALLVEDLDAVVLIRIVRGGDDNARVRALEHGEIRDRRRRQHAERHHIAADGADACNERTFEHIGRNARVLADRDDRLSALFLFQNGRDGLARAECEIGGQIFTDNASDPVGTKQFSHNTCSSS